MWLQWSSTEHRDYCAAASILLLHGNPSWSFVWREVIPLLTDAGHQVFALDWLGHGASDKLKSAHLISFELHIRTLLEAVEELDLKDFFLAAHDWGGCVALCSLPFLPQTRNCAGVLLLNTFFPARPADVSFHSYVLFLAWIFSTGTFGALVPESWILRFMAPECTSVTAWAYDSPYHGLPRSAKASIQRFAHIVPGIPDFVLRQRGTRIWRLCEGLLGPNNFTNVTAQAILAERNKAVRAWWSGGSTIHDNVPSHLEDMSSLGGALPTLKSPVAGINEGKAKSVPDMVMILFGADDPLLPEFKAILENNVAIAACIHPSPNIQDLEVPSPEIGRPSNEPQSRSVKDPRPSASRLPSFRMAGWKGAPDTLQWMSRGASNDRFRYH